MDQESSLTDLFRTVARERGDARTVITHAARSDSKGNGQAEKAVHTVEEMVRTLMIDLESRCGEALSVEDDFFPWLIEHACDLLNKYKVRRGNLTARESIKGEPTWVKYMPSEHPYSIGSRVRCKGGCFPRDGLMVSG